MAFTVSLDDAKKSFTEYTFVAALTPSAQKAAFHVRDKAGQDLCLKIIAPNYERDRLDREIQALQSLNHPNIVKLKEYTFSSKSNEPLRHYIVEEFIEGSDLTARLGKPWNRKDAAKFFSEVSNGLAALKKSSIVHRDLKPANIRVRPDGSPVIIDFGLCRHLNLPDLTRTVQGAQIGTPMYFAPEQFDGTKRDIDHRTDLFALGIIVYQALTGEHPFSAPSIATFGDLRDAVCEGKDHLKRAAFVALPDSWKIIIARLLEKDRARRPAEASQVALILGKMEKG